MNVLPNALSISRFFLAFLLFSHIPIVRLFAIIVAALTDFLDGFLARKFKSISTFGRTIDPLSDKFFVLMGLCIFLQEGTINWVEALLMLSRDAALFLFGIFLMGKGKLSGYPINSMYTGKVTTALQLFVFISITLGVALPFTLFALFGALGLLALFELFYFYLAPTQ